MSNLDAYINDSGMRTSGWGATASLGNTPAQSSPGVLAASPNGGNKDNVSNDHSTGSSNSPIQSPLVIGGIAAAASALLALIVWMTWVLCRSKRANNRRQLQLDDEGQRPKLPADWTAVADNFNRAKSPPNLMRAQSPVKPPPPTLAQQFAFPHNSTGRRPSVDNGPGTPLSSSQGSFTRAKSPQPLSSGRPSPQIQSSRLVPHSHHIKPGAVSKPQPLPHLFSRPLSRDESRILQHHTSNGTVPQPFTKLQPEDVSRIERAVRNRTSVSAEYRQQLLDQQQPHSRDPLNAGHASSAHSSFDSSSRSARGAPPSSFQRKKFSVISSRSKHHSDATSVASSFSFASMPYRSASSLGAVMETADTETDAPYSAGGALSPGGAAVMPAAVARIQPGFHVAKIAFTPLLPDEVELKMNERVTVVDVYNDGWCIVMRSGADVLMGAVPAYCFSDPPADSLPGFERIRPERKSSLGVTVELETGEDAADDDDASDAGRSSRHDSVFSWSNF
ncbi:hypothetical protein BKA62DRAFT_287090 [Auriculariales sp. MPI-PUGE-AT-0066]|nr:hypothetical protein BKA62DRAFT_287090 [Auriculariales sp. MPI-PUGE-AT-0066]